MPDLGMAVHPRSSGKTGYFIKRDAPDLSFYLKPLNCIPLNGSMDAEGSEFVKKFFQPAFCVYLQDTGAD